MSFFCDRKGWPDGPVGQVVEMVDKVAKAVALQYAEAFVEVLLASRERVPLETELAHAAKPAALVEFLEHVAFAALDIKFKVIKGLGEVLTQGVDLDGDTAFIADFAGVRPARRERNRLIFSAEAGRNNGNVTEMILLDLFFEQLGICF